VAEGRAWTREKLEREISLSKLSFNVPSNMLEVSHAENLEDSRSRNSDLEADPRPCATRTAATSVSVHTL
jgi:hypothetical protein